MNPNQTSWAARVFAGTELDRLNEALEQQSRARAEAEAFYAGTLGFAITAHYPGAAFYGSGGYHHHLATNVWNSRGATTRSPSTGLAAVEILADPTSLAAITARSGGATDLVDPWGTRITLTAKAA